MTDLSNEDWEQTVGVDLTSEFYGSRAALSHLKESKGSTITQPPSRGVGAITVSKHTMQ